MSFLHSTSQVLDLSENKLDTVSARSLSLLLKDPACNLREVRLAKADIDDCETVIVMEVSEATALPWAMG